MSSRCAVCTALQKDRRKAKGTNGRAIDDNPEGFTFPERIRYACPYGGTRSRISIDSGYPIHIPYDLCTLTMYHR